MSTTEHPGENIKEFFKDRSIFITGATGFMGKVLIEKLLRTCQEVKTVYVLLRAMPNVDSKQRIDTLLRAEVFDRLKKECPDALAKLVAVSGDIQKDGLGLAEEDEELLTSKVSVVIHLAATIRFDEKLQDSVDINVLGTKRVLDLCSKMHHLLAAVHVSTAFCNCELDEIQEVVYPLPHSPKNVIEALRWMDDDLVATITPKLVGNRPNTYIYTKALAEQLVSEEYNHLPIAIVRPSMVIASLKEPFPGWIETVFGPTGLVIGYSKGVVRCVNLYPEKICDMIPVDISINMIIAVAWYTATHTSDNVKVYNCISGNQIQMTWRQLQQHLDKQVFQNPVSNVVWYPEVTYCRSRVLFKVLSALTHFFPLSCLDMVARLSGKKPLIIPTLQKFHKAFNSLQYFANRQWKFTTDNVTALWETLAPQDQQDFNFEIRLMDLNQYIENYFAGIKLYILKEEPSSLPAARSHLHKMYLVYLLFRIFGLVAFWRLLVTSGVFTYKHLKF